MLFHRAWNLDYSEAQHRDMMTGKHIVRDVMCRVCHKKVGWMYEFAMEESQRYKEARVILEKALIDEEDGFPDPAGALETHEQPPSYLCALIKILLYVSFNDIGFLPCCIRNGLCIRMILQMAFTLYVFYYNCQMPRMFFEHWGGRRTFSCEKCGTYLSNRQEVVSTRFSGSTGRAFLFRRVANTRQGNPVVRKLTTGNHLVRDVFCLCCGTKLGWLYEFTCEVAERYKEVVKVAHTQEGDVETGEEMRAMRFCLEFSRRGSVSPGANSGDEYDVGFRDDALEADFARLLKRTRGFDIKVVRGDGSCMFRAVADQLYADQDMHGEVRRLCMDYMARFSERNRDHFAPFVAENFSSYVARKRQPGQHGNHVELQAISEMFARPIEIYEYSENPRNVFYPTIRSLDVNVPIRLSYHGSSHYNSVVDPFAPTAGIGLGLPDLYPRGANNLREAVKESEDRSVEQAILESQLALTDIERTEREINEQIARDSYMEYLRMLMDSGNPAPGPNTSKREHLRHTKGSSEVQGGTERRQPKSTLYEELLALDRYCPL
ncbi:yippee putative zinc-binding protein [Ostertagia ostertagi]